VSAPGASASQDAPGGNATQAPSIDPITGQTVTDGGNPAALADGAGAPIAYTATNLSAGQGASPGLAVLTAVLLLAALAAPPLLARRWRASGGGGER
jgi:hypothetical protein